jgi:hypothetical protein
MNMNEPELENELRSLRPIAPSPDLEDRIAADLAARRVPASGVLARPIAARPIAGWLRSLGWAAAGAAALIALAMYWQEADRPAPPLAAEEEEAGEFVPAESERELIDADDSGIRYVDGEGPVREMRFRSLERYAWVNPETGARVEVEVPREDVVLLPVAMQ